MVLRLVIVPNFESFDLDFQNQNQNQNSVVVPTYDDEEDDDGDSDHIEEEFCELELLNNHMYLIFINKLGKKVFT